MLQFDTSSSNYSTTRVSVSPKKADEKKFKYSVKIINRSRKSEYRVKKLATTNQFKTIDELQSHMLQSLDLSTDDFGYIEPGHGLKGRQRWLSGDDDLQEMYRLNENRNEIMLWCYTCEQSGSEIKSTRKRSASKDQDEGGPAKAKAKRQSCAEKISEVEAIVKELQEKHNSQYSVEQFNAWAHMLHLKKHGSYDTPPDLPYFRGCKGKTRQPEPDCVPKSVDPQPVIATTVSPSKKIMNRTECINQLDKWFTLMERGGINRQQYEDLQQKIMKDIL